jgi:hypothetical protein
MEHLQGKGVVWTCWLFSLFILGGAQARPHRALPGGTHPEPMNQGVGCFLWLQGFSSAQIGNVFSSLS